MSAWRQTLPALAGTMPAHFRRNPMRSRQQFTEKYAESHMNPANQLIHMICVPAIFAASVALGWVVPLGRLIPGLPAGWAQWINLASLGALPVLAFYAALGLPSLLTGLGWLAASCGACLALQAAGAPLLWIAAAVWLLAWAVQVYGHRLEGAKPSFINDLLFLLIGPLFVHDKLVRLLRTGSIHPLLRREVP
jgi:uncharacterized membrane protein YGL010W